MKYMAGEAIKADGCGVARTFDMSKNDLQTKITTKHNLISSRECLSVIMGEVPVDWRQRIRKNPSVCDDVEARAYLLKEKLMATEWARAGSKRGSCKI